MNMHYTKKLVFVIFISFYFKSYSQNNFRTLGESAFGLNHNVSDKYSINFTVRSRYFLYRNNDVVFEKQQYDLYHFSTYNITYSHKLSMGIFYRYRLNTSIASNEIRLMQQFNYVKQNLGVHYAHRFRAEQRFFEFGTIFRKRYRFSVDFPLNGEKLDNGEGYFMGGIEGLLSLSDQIKPITDFRTTAIIGCKISSKFKLQGGLEYRIEGFNQRTLSTLFILSSAILKI